MCDLDFQMQLDCDRDNLSSHDKARMYQKILEHYKHHLEQYGNRRLDLLYIKSPPPPTPTPGLKTPPAEPVYKEAIQLETNISPIEKVAEPPSQESKQKTYMLREKSI